MSFDVYLTKLWNNELLLWYSTVQIYTYLLEEFDALNGKMYGVYSVYEKRVRANIPLMKFYRHYVPYDCQSFLFGRCYAQVCQRDLRI